MVWNFELWVELTHFLKQWVVSWVNSFLKWVDPCLTFVHSKCKRSSLRSQCWMRLFLWFSNTVQIYFHKIVHLLWHPTLQEMVGVHPDAVGFLKRIKINDFCFCIFDRLTLLKFGLRWRLLIPRTFCFVLKYLSHFCDSWLPLVLTQFSWNYFYNF